MSKEVQHADDPCDDGDRDKASKQDESDCEGKRKDWTNAVQSALEYKKEHEPRVPDKRQAGYEGLAGESYSICVPTFSEEGPSLADMGVGISLYFEVLNIFSRLFLVMFIVGIPSVVITFTANPNIVPEAVAEGGPIGALKVVTIGAMFKSYNTSTYGCDVDVCTMSDGNTIPTTSFVYAIVYLDLLASLVFLAVVRYLFVWIGRREAAIDAGNITAADYTVMVSGVPRDVTEGELFEHFKSYDGTVCPDPNEPAVVPGWGYGDEEWGSSGKPVFVADNTGVQDVLQVWVAALRQLYIEAPVPRKHNKEEAALPSGNVSEEAEGKVSSGALCCWASAQQNDEGKNGRNRLQVRWGSIHYKRRSTVQPESPASKAEEPSGNQVLRRSRGEAGRQPGNRNDGNGSDHGGGGNGGLQKEKKDVNERVRGDSQETEQESGRGCQEEKAGDEGKQNEWGRRDVGNIMEAGRDGEVRIRRRRRITRSGSVSGGDFGMGYDCEDDHFHGLENSSHVAFVIKSGELDDDQKGSAFSAEQRSDPVECLHVCGSKFGDSGLVVEDAGAEMGRENVRTKRRGRRHAQESTLRQVQGEQDVEKRTRRRAHEETQEGSGMPARRVSDVRYSSRLLESPAPNDASLTSAMLGSEQSSKSRRTGGRVVLPALNFDKEKELATPKRTPRRTGTQKGRNRVAAGGEESVSPEKRYAPENYPAPDTVHTIDALGHAPAKVDTVSGTKPSNIVGNSFMFSGLGDRFRGVADVRMARKDDRVLQVLRRRAELIREAEEGGRRGCCWGRSKSEIVENHIGRLDRHLDTLSTGEVFAAFVTFKTVLGKKDCLRHYRSEDRRTFLCFGQPREEFLLDGKTRLHVTPAAEPSDVLWENTHVGFWERCLRRVFSNSVSIIAIVATFAIIVGSKSFQLALSSNQDQCTHPQTVSQCNVHVRWDSNISSNTKNTTLGALWNISEHRKDLSLPLYLDTTLSPAKVLILSAAQCVWREVSPYMCHAPTADAWMSFMSVPLLFPDIAETNISKGNETMLGSNASNVSEEVCRKCFCTALMNNAPDLWVQSVGFQGGWQKISENTTLSGGYCQAQATEFLGYVGLQAGAIAAVVIFNAFMPACIRAMAVFERHHTRTDLESSVSWSVFVGQFVNTALVGLLVYARIDSVHDQLSHSSAGQTILARVPLFGGLFSDFQNRWYAIVGVSIITTVLIGLVLPFLPMLTSCIGRCCRPVRSRLTRTQHQLNELYSGSEFELSARFGSFLSTLFICLMYSSGMPILLLFAAVSFTITYVIDKYALLRLSHTPAAYSGALAKAALRSCKYAIILHLLIGAWLFSATYSDGSLMFPRPPIGLSCTGYSELACGWMPRCSWADGECLASIPGVYDVSRLMNAVIMIRCLAVTLPYTLVGLFIAAVAALGFTPLYPVSLTFFGGDEKSDNQSIAEGLMPTYATAVKTKRFGSHPENYNICQQPRYEAIFHAGDNEARYRKISPYRGCSSA